MASHHAVASRMRGLTTALPSGLLLGLWLLASGHPASADGPSLVDLYPERREDGRVYVVGRWSDGAYTDALRDYPERRPDGSEVYVVLWGTGSYSVAVRQYPERRADGSTWFVRAWEDGAYTAQLITPPQSSPPVPLVPPQSSPPAPLVPPVERAAPAPAPARRILLIDGIDSTSDCPPGGGASLPAGFVANREFVRNLLPGDGLRVEVGGFSYSGRYLDCSTATSYAGPDVHAFGALRRPSQSAPDVWVPGYGPGDTCQGVERFSARLAQELRTLATQYPDDEIHLVGFSLGGLVAARGVMSLPSDLLTRIRSLIVLDSPVYVPVPSGNPLSSCSGSSASWRDLTGVTGMQGQLHAWYQRNPLPFRVVSVLQTPIGSALPQGHYFVGHGYDTGGGGGFFGFLLALGNVAVCLGTGGWACVALPLAPVAPTVFSWTDIGGAHGTVWGDPVTVSVFRATLASDVLLFGSVRAGGKPPLDAFTVTAEVGARVCGRTQTYSKGGLEGWHVLALPSQCAPPGSKVRLALAAPAAGSRRGEPVFLAPFTASNRSPAGRDSVPVGPGINPRADLTTRVTPPCTPPPVSGFGRVWSRHAEVRAGLVCAVQRELSLDNYTVQRFENGLMLWIRPTPELASLLPTDAAGNIFLLFGDDMSFIQVPDTWLLGDPGPGAETPPVGMVAASGGLGKVWRDLPGVRGRLGWAIEPEKVGGPWSPDPQAALNGATQAFLGGTLLWIPHQAGTAQYERDRWIYGLNDSTHTWVAFPDE